MQHIHILAFMLLIALTSCDESSSSEVDDTKAEIEVPEYSPKNIIGKSLILYNSKMQHTLKASAFSANNTCSVPMLTSDFSLVSTPTYNFSKLSATNGSLTVNYTYKLRIGSNITISTLTYQVSLLFNSATTGTYSGSESDRTTYNSGTPTNGYRVISGSFGLY